MAHSGTSLALKLQVNYMLSGEQLVVFGLERFMAHAHHKYALNRRSLFIKKDDNWTNIFIKFYPNLASVHIYIYFKTIWIIPDVHTSYCKKVL